MSLTADHSNSTTSPTNATGLAFTPVANKAYEVRIALMLTSVATTTGARPGLTFPTGLVRAPFNVRVPNTLTADVVLNDSGMRGPLLSDATSAPYTGNAFFAEMNGIVIAGGSPSGAVQVTLRSEVAASSVSILAGSFLRYREIPWTP